jgi:hypothetical protein
MKAYICCHCGDRGVPLSGKIELGSFDRAESPALTMAAQVEKEERHHHEGPAGAPKTFRTLFALCELAGRS